MNEIGHMKDGGGRDVTVSTYGYGGVDTIADDARTIAESGDGNE
jgi:hypothetical protein